MREKHRDGEEYWTPRRSKVVLASALLLLVTEAAATTILWRANAKLASIVTLWVVGIGWILMLAYLPLTRFRRR